MTAPYETRVTRLTLTPKGTQIFDEGAMHVEIDDEAGGEFVILSQPGGERDGKVYIDPSEWPALRAAINRMVAQCRDAG